MPLGAYNYLARGMTGAGVQEMQSDLLSLGFTLSQYGADGNFGSETETAVRNFQYTWGITVDGVVGAQTAAAIKQAVEMVAAGTWNPSTDVSVSPAVASIPKSYAKPISIPTVAAPTPGPFGLDWKWIGIGVLAVMAIAYFASPKEGGEEN